MTKSVADSKVSEFCRWAGVDMLFFGPSSDHSTERLKKDDMKGQGVQKPNTRGRTTCKFLTPPQVDCDADMPESCTLADLSNSCQALMDQSLWSQPMGVKEWTHTGRRLWRRLEGELANPT